MLQGVPKIKNQYRVFFQLFAHKKQIIFHHKEYKTRIIPSLKCHISTQTPNIKQDIKTPTVPRKVETILFYYNHFANWIFDVLMNKEIKQGAQYEKIIFS